jgi:adenine deaminase
MIVRPSDPYLAKTKQGDYDMTANNESYDIVLANGRVIDPETYLDGQMHVGIQGDRIAAVSESPLEGKEVIDVSGMIVVKDSKVLKDVFPGKPIRLPVQ